VTSGAGRAASSKQSARGPSKRAAKGTARR
jgi:hypothetical protein